MSKILAITPTMSPDTGWGRYSVEVVTELEKRNKHEYISWTGLGDPMKFNRMKNPLGAWNLAKAAIKLRHKIKKERVDAVLSLISHPYSIASYLATTGGSNIPYFVCCHGTYSVAPLYYRTTRHLTHQSFKHSNMLFPVSTFTAERIREAAPNISNITVGKNGIRPETFGEVEPFDVDHNTILTVGPFKNRKGQQLGVKAFIKIASRYPDVEYHLIGKKEGAYYEETRQLVNEFGLADRVHFEGFVSENELHRWYKTADIYLFPAQYMDNHHFEGFGLVLLEANWYGAPAVGTTCSGAIDAISDGISGLLAAPEPEEIASKLEELLSSETFRSRMSKDATRWAREHNWDKTAATIERKINRVI